MSSKLIVIEGPTASGKTALAIEIASRLNTVILSADSRQFYKEVQIGTAKPSIEEQAGIHHYFIDSHSLTDEVTSAQFATEALAVLEQEFKLHDTIVLVGGSGMFIDALCIGLDDIPKSDALRNAITQEWNENGLNPLLEELERVDPIYYEQVDRNNPLRIIRAIEVYRLTGTPFSSFRINQPKAPFFEVKRFVINHDRTHLYERINQRVDGMIAAGLEAEVRSVNHLRGLKTLNTVGYTEFFDYFDGNKTLEETIIAIKQNTRRYAKRQLTWFRRHQDAVWIDFTTTNEMADEILKLV